MSADLAVPPSGVVTFLFTDVEWSTRRWEADTEAMWAVVFPARESISSCSRLAAIMAVFTSTVVSGSTRVS